MCDFAKRGGGIIDSFVDEDGFTTVMWVAVSSNFFKETSSLSISFNSRTLDGNYTKVNTVKQARKYMTNEAVSIQNEEIGKARRKELIQSGQEKHHQTSSPNVLKTQSATRGRAKVPRTDGNICQQKLDEIQQPQVEGGIKIPLHGAGTHWTQQPWFWGVNQPPYVPGFQHVVVGGAVQHPPVANLNQHPPVANLTQHPTMANLIQQPQPALNGIQQPQPVLNGIQQPQPVLNGMQQQQPPPGFQQPPPGLNGIQQLQEWQMGSSSSQFVMRFRSHRHQKRKLQWINSECEITDWARRSSVDKFRGEIRRSSVARKI